MDQTYFKDKWLDDDSPYAGFLVTLIYNVLQNTL